MEPELPMEAIMEIHTDLAYLRSPDEITKTYKGAYSFTVVEHFLWNISNRWSLNPYAVFTKSKGGSASNDKAADYYNREIFNRKTEFNTNQSHLLF
jgi:maltoporin